ncbi:hypothetical protein SDJN03_08848, partial [Cucurbita argyrosperma subsp. sororia]
MILGHFRLRESHPQSLLSLISMAYALESTYLSLGKGERQPRKRAEPNKNGEQARPPIVIETTSTSELQTRAGEGVQVALLRLSLPEIVKIPPPLPVVPTNIGLFLRYQLHKVPDY